MGLVARRALIFRHADAVVLRITTSRVLDRSHVVDSALSRVELRVRPHGAQIAIPRSRGLARMDIDGCIVIRVSRDVEDALMVIAVLADPKS